MKINFKAYVLSLLPLVWAHSLRWIRIRKKIPSWIKPCTYDEKIHWLSIYYWDKEVSQYADKFLVRNYLIEKKLAHILVKLYAVYNKADEIDFSILPEQFILKVNHASGEKCYEICTNKDDLNEEFVINKMNDALKYDFWRTAQEYHYKYIDRKIICEELLIDSNRKNLNDYKVVCSYGQAKYILVCSERDEGRDYYDTEWNYCDFVKEEYRSGHLEKKPEQLDELLRYAEILSEPFPLARVDFYIVNNKVYFGEITLTPSAGFHNNLNEKGQIELGKVITLPKKKRRSKRISLNI